MKKMFNNSLSRLLALLLVVLLIGVPIAAAANGDASSDVVNDPLDEPISKEVDLDAQEIDQLDSQNQEDLQQGEQPGAEGQNEESNESGNKEKTFADLTPEEQYAAIQTMTDEQIEAALATLTEEQADALVAYAQSVATYEVPETVVFTQAGPLMPPVKVESVRPKKLMAKAVPKRSSNSPEGLELDKNVTDNGDGTYTITLESYTTGEVVSHEVSTPVDIVLVLDQSGSMAYGFDGNSASYANSRQKAMKDAVQNFIDSVHEKYSESADHRISIVTFGSNASDLIGWTNVDDAGYATLSSEVDGLPQNPSGATNVGAGMGRAQHLVTDELNYSGSNTNRQKVVVVFTDGIPTTSTDFSTGVATGAINAAKNIKDSGATVYSVGIFNGANPNELYGASGFDTNSNGTVGSRWVMDTWGLFPGSDFPEADRPAGNRFLNYLSSNVPSATGIGLTRSTIGLGILHYRITYQITQNFSKTSNNYYLTASDSSSLDNVFQSIAEQIATPAIDLGSETVIKDIISPQLQIPEGSTVKFYTQASTNGTDGWGPRTEVTDGSIHLVPDQSDPNIVDVTGFNFNDNCVTEEPKEDGTHGKKLVIEITVEPGENFLGGTIDTNGPESGIYVPGSDTPVGTFDVPKEPFPLKPIVPDTAERNVYMTSEDELADTFSDLTFTLNGKTITFENLFNGVNNSGVDYEFQIKDSTGNIVGVYRISAGKTPSDEGAGWDNGNIPNLTDLSYTIDSIVSDKNYPTWDPRLDPNAPEYDPNAPQPVISEGKITLNVFKPILTYTDKNVYYKGQQISYQEPTVEWKHGDTLDTSVTMHTHKPVLSMTYSGLTGTTVDQMTDYTVKVETMVNTNNNADLLSEKFIDGVTFLRNCTPESLTNAAATKDEAYKVHVYTPSFTFDDMAKYYGEEITLPTVDDAAWKNSDGTAAPATMDNTKPTLAVTLTTDPTNAIQNGYVWATEDFNVKAVITLDGTDVTGDLITAGKVTRTCTPGEDTGTLNPTTDVAFVVHVKTIKLTVTKEIKGDMANLSGQFNFTVSFTPNGTGAPTYTYSGTGTTADSFTLGNNESVTLDKLPLGTITITETDIPAGYEVQFKLNTGSAQNATVSNGSASKELALTNKAAEENTLVVTNKLPDVVPTGIADGMNGIWFLAIALSGLTAAAYVSARKRNAYRGKHSA